MILEAIQLYVVSTMVVKVNAEIRRRDTSVKDPVSARTRRNEERMIAGARLRSQFDSVHPCASQAPALLAVLSLLQALTQSFLNYAAPARLEIGAMVVYVPPQPCLLPPSCSLTG